MKPWHAMFRRGAALPPFRPSAGDACRTPAARRNPTAGVTLIEMMAALAIFALIGGAGFTMLDQVLRTDARTAVRLDRLGDLQRAMLLSGRDFSQADAHSLRVQGNAVTIRRDGIDLRYHLSDGVLLREVAADVPVAQRLVDGALALRWRFLDEARVWRADWQTGSGTPRNPRAVELVLTLPGGQDLRQVMALPAEAG